MGNQQSAYAPIYHQPSLQQGIVSQTVQYGGVAPITTITGAPVTGYNIQQNEDCCGPNIPNSFQNSNCCGPSYQTGIVNTGLYGQSTNQCCDWNNGVVTNTVGLQQGYGVNGFAQPQSVDQWCCGPAYYGQPGSNLQINTPIGQGYTTRVSQVHHVQNILPITTQVPVQVPIEVQTQLPFGAQLPVPYMRTSYVASEMPIIDPALNAVIQTEVFHPSSKIAEVNPFANLPPRIAAVIEKLGSVNPLRGSIMNRLQTPQYVPEKQAYYEGQWINGYMQGFGRLYFDSGAYFEGEFVNGLAQTRYGLFIYPDGSYYIGGVDKNVANGQGQFNYRNGRLIYKGQFLNDQPDGRGTQLYSDGSRYEGEFRFGKKEGKGQFVWRDGTIYKGQFENGFMQGEGIHNLSNGQTYKGQFRKNKRHGRGTHITALGTYTGGYKRDKKQGQGQFVWADGKIFKGTFHNGKPDGQGSLLMNNGTTVYGIWINGILDQNSLTSNNPFKGSQINPRSSIVSVGSVGSLQNAQFDSNIVRTSQIVAGPPVINLKGGMLAGGFIGTASPFINQRGSIVSVIGSGGDFRGSNIPRGSSLPRGLSIPRGSSINGGSTLIMGNPNVLPISRGSSVTILPNQAPVLNSVLGRIQTGLPTHQQAAITSVPIPGPTMIGRGSTVGLNTQVLAPVINPTTFIPRGSQVIQTNSNIVPIISPASGIRSSSIVNAPPIGVGFNSIARNSTLIAPITPRGVVSVTPSKIQSTTIVTQPPIIPKPQILTTPPISTPPVLTQPILTPSRGQLNPFNPVPAPNPFSIARLSSVSPPRVVGINRPITPNPFGIAPQPVIRR